ncbi:MAG: iron-sulfur cluster assembly accessory protein [Rhodospirillales bacterium]|nr:iron-sulfur cluster assembly accessory protein [Rhodospirillales bacterium]
MLELTENAAGAIKRAIERSQEDSSGLRVTLVDGGCAEMKFKLDLVREASAGDGVFNYDGFSIFIDPATGDLIKGTRVDYVENLDGGSFVFQNPQAESTCVCGKSFTPARDA